MEKSAEVKVYNKFNAKRLRKFKRIIADDRVVLDTYVKIIQDVLSEGGNINNSCLSLSKITEDIEKQLKEHEKKLADISQSFDPLLVSMRNQ